MKSKYQQNPVESHWMVAKNILKYLRRTKDMFLVYGGVQEDLSLRCYADASLTIDLQAKCCSAVHYRVRIHSFFRSYTRSCLDEEIHWRSSAPSI